MFYEVPPLNALYAFHPRGSLLLPQRPQLILNLLKLALDFVVFGDGLRLAERLDCVGTAANLRVEDGKMPERLNEEGLVAGQPQLGGSILQQSLCFRVLPAVGVGAAEMRLTFADAEGALVA